MSAVSEIDQRTYAGVLGKIIGVYLGRPVEGWPYQEIRDRFGQIRHYVNDQLGLPVVTADDDISGAHAFARAVVDHGGEPTAAQVGETWLNYVVENRTILWWGGRGRSTEHTAYLNLRDGVRAPESGSFARNGTTLPVQVGAQIFVDVLAMMAPGDPDRAARIARAAASVSHDGVAVQAAGFVAAAVSEAFRERDLVRVLAVARGQLDDELCVIVDQVLAWCAEHSDWRVVRDLVEDAFGYSRYRGPCPVTTNLAGVVMALALGRDSFAEAVSIASSAGWDTDSNAGVVGAITGVRLGLTAITAQVDLRGPVADRLLVVTADGGECVTDAVRQTRTIRAAAALLQGEPEPPQRPRFGFELPGSVQGFDQDPLLSSSYASVTVDNVVATPGPAGSRAALRLRPRGLGPGSPVAVATETFLDPPGEGDNFSTIASPTLYPGNRVRVRARLQGGPSAAAPTIRPYVVTTRNGRVVRGEPVPLTHLGVELSWVVPDVGRDPIQRVGIELSAISRFDGVVVVEEVDWAGAPDGFTQSGVLLSSIWDLHPEPLRAWVSSASGFEPDFRCTYSISHPRGTGLATIGCRDWTDYRVSTTLVPNPHQEAGVVVRAHGHRLYHAAVLDTWSRLRLLRRDHDEVAVLDSTHLPYTEDEPLHVQVSCVGDLFTVHIDGEERLRAHDDSPRRGGGAGFLVTTGTVLADGFRIDRLDPHLQEGTARP